MQKKLYDSTDLYAKLTKIISRHLDKRASSNSLKRKRKPGSFRGQGAI